MSKASQQLGEGDTARRMNRITSRPLAEQYSFGSTLFKLRQRRNCPQFTIAKAADLSAGYYSDLENNKRVAPPEQTTKRIGIALELATHEMEQLLVLAAADRAAMVMSNRLSPRVRRLLAAVLIAGPTLPAKTIDTMYAMLSRTSTQHP